MSEGHEIRATREEVEQFVGKLEGFYGSLDPAGQAMLGTILEGRNRRYDWVRLQVQALRGPGVGQLGFGVASRGIE